MEKNIVNKRKASEDSVDRTSLAKKMPKPESMPIVWTAVQDTPGYGVLG